MPNKPAFCFLHAGNSSTSCRANVDGHSTAVNIVTCGWRKAPYKTHMHWKLRHLHVWWFSIGSMGLVSVYLPACTIKINQNVGIYNINIPYMACIRLQRLVFSATSPPKRHGHDVPFRDRQVPGIAAQESAEPHGDLREEVGRVGPCPVAANGIPRNPPRGQGWVEYENSVAPCFLFFQQNRYQRLPRLIYIYRFLKFSLILG